MKDYSLETRKGDVWTFRMSSTDRDYLEDRGKEWLRLEFIDEYKIEVK